MFRLTKKRWIPDCVCLSVSLYQPTNIVLHRFLFVRTKKNIRFSVNSCKIDQSRNILFITTRTDQLVLGLCVSQSNEEMWWLIFILLSFAIIQVNYLLISGSAVCDYSGGRFGHFSRLFQVITHSRVLVIYSTFL